MNYVACSSFAVVKIKVVSILNKVVSILKWTIWFAMKYTHTHTHEKRRYDHDEIVTHVDFLSMLIAVALK